MYNLFVMSDFENPIDNSYIPIDIGLFYDNVQSSENQQDAGIAILTKEEETLYNELIQFVKERDPERVVILETRI